MIDVTLATAPAYWASALVDGNYSSLAPTERAACDAWMRAQGEWYVVDVDRDAAGEARDPRWTRYYALYGGTADGGDVLEYVMHRVRASLTVETGRDG
jgi:hypothetical protein